MKDKNYFLSFKTIVLDRDTFKVEYISKDLGIEYYWLELEKIFINDTFKLSYHMQID